MNMRGQGRRRPESSSPRHRGEMSAPRRRDAGGDRERERAPTPVELRELPQGSKIQWRFTKDFLEGPQEKRAAAVVDATAIANQSSLPLSKEAVLKGWERHAQQAIDAYRQNKQEDPQMTRKHLAYAALWIATVRHGRIEKLEDVEAANKSVRDVVKYPARSDAGPDQRRDAGQADVRGPRREPAAIHAAATTALEKARPNVSDKGKELLLEVALKQHVDAQLGPKEAAGAFAEQMQALREKSGQGETVQKMLAFAALSLVRPHTEVVRDVKGLTPESQEKVRTDAFARVEGLGSTPEDRKGLETTFVESNLRQLFFPSDDNRYKMQVAAMAISEHIARGSGVSTDWEQLGDDLLA